MITLQAKRSDWQISIGPNRLKSLFTSAICWIAFLPLILWSILGERNIALMCIFLAYPAIITYYGVKSARGMSGRLDVDEVGFNLQRPDGGPERVNWEDVDRFFVAKFGGTPVHPGIDVPHFMVASGSGGWRESWLPGNLGVPPEQMVAAMEHLRALHLQGWPSRPESFQALLLLVANQSGVSSTA